MDIRLTDHWVRYLRVLFLYHNLPEGWSDSTAAALSENVKTFTSEIMSAVHFLTI